MRVPLSKPEISEADIAAVRAVMESGRLALGPQAEAFERAVAERADKKYGIATSSGTAALHIALLSGGIGPGDEVITSPFSFVASVNAILYTGASVVFADVEKDSLCLDAAAVEAAITPHTKAILPVHVFGAMADMKALRALADRHGLSIIEDACESLGSVRDGVSAGSLGDLAAFAFYPNKQVTTGEGGMLVTDSDGHAALARSLRNQGRADDGGWLEHARLGYNYRMDEMSAALGVSQVQRLDSILERRARVAEWYNARLAEVAEVETLAHVPGCTRSWFVYMIFLREPSARERLIEHLRNAGVDCRVYFPSLHLLPHIAARGNWKRGSFPVTEAASEAALALPFFTTMTEKQVMYACDAVAAFFA